jgi:hypothetical protein
MENVSFKGSNVTKSNTPKKLELWMNIILYSAPIIAATLIASPYGDHELLSFIALIWTNTAVILKGVSKFFGVKTL